MRVHLNRAWKAVLIAFVAGLLTASLAVALNSHHQPTNQLPLQSTIERSTSDTAPDEGAQGGDSDETVNNQSGTLQ